MISLGKAHVIIPTHSAHDTLNFAVLSAINQSLPPHRVTIIGDGVTPSVRKVAQELAREFKKVDFLDKPKLKNRGEFYRDEVIRASDSDFVSYLCDDDLFMPNHLELMSKHLEEYDFAHPRPTFVNPDGTFFFMPSGIEIPRIRSWHRLEPQQNTISLTGASHTRKSYLSLTQGWDAGPPEYWTDLYMWVKFLADPGVTAFTSPLTTTIKLMHTKSQRSLLNRGDLTKFWYDIISQADKLASFQSRLGTQLKETLFDNSVELASIRAVITAQETVIQEKDALIADKDVVIAGRDAAIAERDQILASNSWRITKPLRRISSLLKNL